MNTNEMISNNGGPQPGNETVYGTEDYNMVMSDKVQQLAGSIYQEFERMINRYDEDVVKNLMPLLVNVLECLDASYRINQEQDVELELLREDNEQLVTQYEREKCARKQSEQKLLETEDLAEQENKELASRLESLESIVRMLELKHKNSLEHASRLEEREGDLKKEYNKLHERYTDLFKNHVDYMERTKMLMGSTHSQMSSTSERLDMNRVRSNPIVCSSGSMAYGFVSLDNSAALDAETICSVGSNSDESGPPSLQNELENTSNKHTLHTQPNSPQHHLIVDNRNVQIVGRSTTKKEQRSGNTLYQELSFQDNEESEDNEMITGSWVHPGDYASSGMGKEVENLIIENNELLATKNALNIVKDDLIVKVDELTGEIEILKEELNTVQQSRNKLRSKVTELEEELKKVKEQLKEQVDNEHDENDVPLAQRKRFTRVEMAMVLMERNQYKERLMELQEAVRLTEIIRASRTVDNLDKKSKQSIWKYFSNLFTSSNRPQERCSDAQDGDSIMRYTGHHIRETSNRSVDNSLVLKDTEIVNPLPQHTDLANTIVFAKDYYEDGSSERAAARRREQYRQLRAHVQKDDGRLQAYGWSLPITKSLQGYQNNQSGSVPVPVYCNPLAETQPHMKVFCASGVNLSGGFTKSGQFFAPVTSIYIPHLKTKLSEISNTPAVMSNEVIDRQILRSYKDNLEPDNMLTSFVWICTSTYAASSVIVIDANQPANVLDTFPICGSHLLSIASVQGAMESDYTLLENSEMIKFGEMLERPGEGPEYIGKVEFVRTQSKLERTPAEKGIITEEPKKAEVPKSDQISNGQEIKVSGSIAKETDTEIENSTSQIFSKATNPILGTTGRQEPSMNSVGPTMWLGAQDGWLYVHSSLGRWYECLHKVLLPDAVLAIAYVESRVVVALANGQLATFRRQTNGQWDLNNYHLVYLGDRNHSIRCLCVVEDRIWAAHRNKIFVIDPISLNIIDSLEAHPRKESQVRQMAATKAGVWVSIRLDSTLRLYNSQNYKHIQDVDIEPYVSKMLGTGKLGFSFVRITALTISCDRLWIGTSNGVIISVPLSESQSKLSNIKNQAPLCCMANAQLSFHGHRDAVKFFVSVPMQPLPGNTHQFLNKTNDMLVLCGGEGYIDFRINDNEMENSIHMESNQSFENRLEKSYLIVWHVTQR